jgi:hypothetical protein
VTKCLTEASWVVGASLLARNFFFLKSLHSYVHVVCASEEKQQSCIESQVKGFEGGYGMQLEPCEFSLGLDLDL